VLGLESDSTLSLYAALAIIICGYGLFKSHISCLLGELYAPDDEYISLLGDAGFTVLQRPDSHTWPPEGINWPENDDGLPSFRLEHLTQANGIEHSNAHDAMADVYAT
ncbi:hypothetical protein MJL33_27915, partial [Salmonella enterica subsp. enterica serovar Kentucky]|nr:hypothetical protein [Salmonella enterica subsp. enterica serovar Kentucky]